MSDIITNLYNNYFNIVKLTIFNYLKTDNPLYDAILTTVVLSFIGYIINYVYDNNYDKLLSNISINDIPAFFYKKNTLILEGKQSSTISAYNLSHNVSSLYSDRFKAMWHYIIQHIETTDTIHCIKETVSNYQSCSIDDRYKPLNIFMVHQNKHFCIDKDIFIHTKIDKEESKDEREKICTKTDKIILNIYSYARSLNDVKNYVENITETYLASIKDNRQNKRFIYFLDKVKHNEDESVLNCWREDVFESSRTFDNIFFDGKRELIDKIDFFLENRNWYYEKGIPYSLGIGLHGPPGTGKTSFIKALANYTNRHIIVISLKIINTKRQLENFFFENRYHEKNEYNGIPFDKKIIVFEDIDCIGDIILERSKLPLENEPFRHKSHLRDSDNVVKIGEVIQTICGINDGVCHSSISSADNPITLDDILNLWDGIRETPGRILVISSNHYHKLDQALVRPGRIDISHELSNASHATISELYYHLFGTHIPKQSLKKIKEYYYSPAELINLFVSYKNKTDFLNRVLENRKL